MRSAGQDAPGRSGLGSIRSRQAGRRRARAALCVAVLLVGLACAQAAIPGSGPDTAPAAAPASPTSSPALPTPESLYGAWVLIPPAITIILAIALRQVVPALTVGILVAAYMLEPCLSREAAYGGGIIGGLRLSVEGILVGVLADPDHIKILLFTLAIGAMVGIIAANGGTQAVVDRVSKWASSPQRGQITGWAAGLLVFFDDYANAMIVGPAMRPIYDRLRISRAKLAYIVDSTAAPVASIALIGTWVGAEIGYIDIGLKQLTHRPVFLEHVTAYNAFLSSIPYRFYAILALVMVLVVGWLGRDFGPMKQAERQAAAGEKPGVTTARQAAPAATGRSWYAVTPVAVMVVLTVALLGVTGWPDVPLSAVKLVGEGPHWLLVVQHVVSEADPYNSLLYGALASVVVAIAISLATGTLTLGRTMDAATEAMSRLLPTLIVLVLAWALSHAMNELRLGFIAADLLEKAQLDATWLPMLIFVSSCVVSFATGTSWGTMGILCPVTVTIAARLLAGVPAEQALPVFYAAVGAVLAGAVFGDHCSPISDTTVISALASECTLESHVWTQLPYALTVAGVSILSGDVICRYYHQPAWVGLLAGSVLLLLIVVVIGRPVAKPSARTAP